MREHGFKAVDTKTAPHSCIIDYQKGDLYVRLLASDYPDQSAPYFKVRLGEGSREYPDCEHNSLALSQMIQLITKNEHETKYLMHDESTLHHNVIRAVNELQSYHGGFLDGCLDFFHQALRSVNTHSQVA